MPRVLRRSSSQPAARRKEGIGSGVPAGADPQPQSRHSFIPRRNHHSKQSSRPERELRRAAQAGPGAHSTFSCGGLLRRPNPEIGSVPSHRLPLGSSGGAVTHRCGALAGDTRTARAPPPPVSPTGTRIHSKFLAEDHFLFLRRRGQPERRGGGGLGVRGVLTLAKAGAARVGRGWGAVR
eukprot:scaffold3652_cov106-Isochrysis_galbana.AAC.2